MKKLIYISMLLLVGIFPAGVATAQDTTITPCEEGDFGCLARDLEDLRLLIERLPEDILLAPPPPPAFAPDAAVVSIAGPGQTDEDGFPGAGCGTKIRLTVRGPSGSLGYMQCGARVVTCLVTRQNVCTSGVVNIGLTAAGKCGVAATNTGPATALCESQN